VLIGFKPFGLREISPPPSFPLSIFDEMRIDIAHCELKCVNDVILFRKCVTLEEINEPIFVW